MLLSLNGGVLDIVLFLMTGVKQFLGEVCNSLGDDDKEFTTSVKSRLKNAAYGE